MISLTGIWESIFITCHRITKALYGFIFPVCLAIFYRVSCIELDSIKFLLIFLTFIAGVNYFYVIGGKFEMPK